MLDRCVAAVCMAMFVFAGCGADESAGGGVGQQNPTGTTAMDSGQANDAGGESDGTVADSESNDTQTLEDLPEDEPAVGTPCTRDGDCEGDEVCRTSEGGNPPEFECGAPSDGATVQAGGPCTTNAECIHGVCWDGLCGSPCADTSDCPTELSFECISPEAGWPTLCVGPSICQNDDDCDDGDVCTFVVTSTLAIAACLPPIEEGSPDGALCTQHAECAGQLCVDGVCSSPCSTSDTCADPLGCGVVSVDVGGEEVQVQACVLIGEPCMADSGCTEPDLCVAHRLPGRIVWTCGDIVGPSAPGGACERDNDCLHGLCVDGQCFSSCVGNDDCDPTQGTVCTDSTLDLDGEPFELRHCGLPDVCVAREQCDASDVCYTRERGASGLEFVCLPPNDGGSDVGVPCATNAACAANLCLEYWIHQVCSEPCRDNNDCAGDFVCREADLRNATSWTVCVPPDPPECSTDADCPAGLSCTVLANAAEDSLVALCLDTGGSGAPGIGCDEDRDCRSGLCLDETCSALCETRSDCGQEQACVSGPLELEALDGTFSLCRALPDAECDSNVDCSEEGRVCGLVSASGNLPPMCNFPLDDGAGLGESCEGRFSPSSECEERICLSNITDTCTTTCSDDLDCERMDSGVCTDFQFSPVIRMCASRCAHDLDCPTENHLCGLITDRGDDEFDFICRNPRGEDLPGSPCPPNEVNCDHGICLIRNIDENQSERVCTLPCETDADCPGVLPDCGEVTTQRPASEELQTLRVCTIRQ